MGACECLLEAGSQDLSSSLDNAVVRVVHVALLFYLQGVVCSNSRKIEISPMGLTHGFGQKLAILSSFCF